MTKYKIVVPDREYASPFIYYCETIEELKAIYKFVTDYTCHLDFYLYVTVYRAKTQEELSEYQQKMFREKEQNGWYLIDQDHPDYWISYTEDLDGYT